MAEGHVMTAVEVVDKLMSSEHADVIRESARFTVAELMDTEVAALVGAEYGERAPELRSGAAHFPSFLEPRRRAEQALVAVVQEGACSARLEREEDRR